MRQSRFLSVWAVSLLICLWGHAQEQKLDISYARALQKKYPTVKSSLCTSCKLWENPYFKAIADTAAHMPLVTYYIYTYEHRLAQERLNLDRKGLLAAWNPSFNQVAETNVYLAANKAINKPHTGEVIAKGHCQPWILLAWCVDAAILSNTYTFNPGTVPRFSPVRALKQYKSRSGMDCLMFEY